MPVWLPAARLAERRAAVAGPLAPLAASLAADLAPLLDAELPLPAAKARLTRAGGRCPVDAALLVFDPRAPHRHRCAVCGAEYEGEAHDRWWSMGFHLWLAERAVHAAALHALLGDARQAAFACDVLARYTEAYLRYPNADNVLGPSRPFFSTYLESIWLLQLCVALDLLEGVAGPDSLGAAVRERVVAPSMALVASYDEGDSNRQVWNDAALLAAARLLGDEGVAERALWGPSGLAAHLGRALLADGSWYEGENYHLFAHRGLWYGVQLASAWGAELPAELLARFDAGFETPFLTALPDLTFPARRDSQYAVSLRQWRFAELAELGLARRPESRVLRAALARLYDGGAPQRDTGRARSTAEAERNEPAAALDRADLGWRSLLFALPVLPELTASTPASVLLPAQGLAVLRRDGGRLYAALDYGLSGGGHGHPDRLDVLLSVGDERWLDDPGTGSYVDPTLHWYRSTLAHHAPLLNGRSQPPADGVLRAWEERGGAGWVDAEVALAPGVTLRRALVAMPDYLVDELSWFADAPVTLDLPLHAPVAPDVAGGWTGDLLDVEGAGFLRDIQRLERETGGVVPLRRAGEERPAGWVLGDGEQEWWRAVAPGAPGRPSAPMHLVRLRGATGVLRTVWSWRGAVCDAWLADGVVHLRLADGGCHAHARAPHGWHVDLAVGTARSSVDLAGQVAGAPAAGAPAAGAPAAGAPVQPSAQAIAPPAAALSLAVPRRFELGEAQYRRSEPDWREAGAPSATVELSAVDEALVVRVDVRKPALAFVPPGAVNEMDNERPDINGDGVQLHLAPDPPGSDADALGWLLVPELAGGVRVVPLGAGTDLPVTAAWRRTPGGYALEARLPLAGLRARGVAGPRVRLAVIVNESAPGRERRRGQLVLGGVAGEHVYLRGDRHDLRRAPTFVLPDA
ncbi:MAG TPA: heparinase II/III family protein [Gemmatimonadaceae bacterium]|nr:heparinase II/III family protein [Gemmatimonadaceae bacterium]